MKRKIYTAMVGGNRRWTLYASDKRNMNSLRIHDNGLGKTVYKTDKIHDSDVLKIIRVLDDLEDGFVKFEAAVQKINRNCRHLDIPWALIRAQYI